MEKKLVEFAKLFFAGCEQDCVDLGIQIFEFLGKHIDEGNEIEDLDLFILEFLTGILEHEFLNKFEDYPMMRFINEGDETKKVKEIVEYLLETKQVDFKLIDPTTDQDCFGYIKSICKDLFNLNLKLIYFKISSSYIYGLVDVNNAQRIIDIFNSIADKDSNVESGII